MYLSLIRDTAASTYCLGVLHAGALEFQTIERPWIDAPPGLGGHPETSCVPAGLYELVKHDSPKHPKSFALVNPKLDVWHLPEDVPADRRPYARTAVLIHVANLASQLEGCVALGMGRGAGCVYSSALALDSFNLTVPWIVGHSLRIDFAEGIAP